MDDIQIETMQFVEEEKGLYRYSAKIELKTGGDYGYTFRVIPKNKLIPNTMNMNLIKWISE